MADAGRKIGKVAWMVAVATNLFAPTVATSRLAGQEAASGIVLLEAQRAGRDHASAHCAQGEGAVSASGPTRRG